MPTSSLYQLPLKETISTAWANVKGSKKFFFIGLLIYILVVFLGAQIQHISSATTQTENLANYLIPIIQVVLTISEEIIKFTLTAGFIYLGIRKVDNAPISVKNIFYPFKFNLLLKLFCLIFIQIILLAPVYLVSKLAITVFLNSVPAISFSVLILFGMLYLYFLLRLSLATPLILKKNIGVWKAIKVSFAATRKNVLRIFALVIVGVLALLASLLSIGIFSIWAIPFIYICYGELYKRLMINFDPNFTLLD